MVIPMRPGPRGASSRPPLYSQLYHARSRTDLIDLTSMEDESAPHDSRGRVELSRDTVERVRDGSQLVSWMGDYPSEIHVTSPRENPSDAPPGKAESFHPLRSDNNDQHSHENNTQKTEYGWSAHDYPSVVNVTGIDDVSEMGFQSQNGDQSSLRESVPSKKPIVYAQSYHQSKGSTVGLDSTASDILSRMKAITGRIEVERLIGAENDSTSHRNSLSVITGRAIVDGEHILHDDRDDLPLEVNIQPRNDPREGIIHLFQSTHDKIERGGQVPGEVNLSLHPHSPLRYAQVGYGPNHLAHDDGDKDIRENDDSRDLLPSRSSQSSRSTQSMYLRALSRRLSEKWKRNGAMSKAFESLAPSTSEPFAASVTEQALRFRDVESTDCDDPEIIDLNDYEEIDSHFLTNTDSVQTDAVDGGLVKGQMHATDARTDDHPVMQSEPMDVKPSDVVVDQHEPSDEVDQQEYLQSTAEGTESKPDDAVFQKECGENLNSDIGDDKSTGVDDPRVSEADMQPSNKNYRERGRSRVLRAERKRKITGRSLQSPRDRIPVKAAENADKEISERFSENVEPNKVECAPLDEEKELGRPKSEQVTCFDKKSDSNALINAGDKGFRAQNDHKSGLGPMEVKSEERKGKEEHDNVTVNADKDVNKDGTKGNHQLIDLDRKMQPSSLNLNLSDYATTTSGSSTFEVEVEDLYVSSSNSEEGKVIRTASIGDVIQGRSSEEAEDNASVAYSNSSESDLEPEYDIYDQCVMPFIPNFLDTACAWLDGEEYGIRRQQSAASLLYKLQKKNKNVGKRKNSKKNSRSRSKTNRNSKGTKNLNLREVSRFARPRRSVDSYVEMSKDRDPPDRSWQTASSSHAKASTITQPEALGERYGESQLENDRKPDHEPIRFTFSERESTVIAEKGNRRSASVERQPVSPTAAGNDDDGMCRDNKSSAETPKRSAAATPENANRRLSPSVKRLPKSPEAEAKDNDAMHRDNKIGLTIDSQGSHESPFRKKLQERLESIRSRDATGDGEGTMDQTKDVTPKPSPSQLISPSPFRIPQDPPSLTPRAPQPNDCVRSPKQAEIVKISPSTKYNECERNNLERIRPSPPSGNLSGASSSPIHDEQIAIFRDGRLVVTDVLPSSHAVASHHNGTFAEPSQSVAQVSNSERPFDESAQKAETDSDQSFANKLRERNSKRVSNAAGGPETLQGIRARRRMIEQKQYASSSRNRRSYQEHESNSGMYEQSEKSRTSFEGTSSSPRTTGRTKDQSRSTARHSRSPSKRNERITNSKPSREKGNSSETDSDGSIDVIDAEMFASMAVMDEDERNAALELVEKLRLRASTLQKRHKVRSRRPKNIEELQQQNKRFIESSNNDRFAYVPRQEWEGNGFSISAA